VKTYDPISGACFKVKVVRSNELSRIWSALGPMGVSITKQGRKDGGSENIVKQQRGISSLMSGVEFALPIEPAEASAVPAAPTAASSSSTAGGAKKKKSKKK
jgi:Signal recognition particle 9 kDa protein (SRP9)